MALFKQSSNYLGVDIGSAGIKVVELTKEGGRPRLVTYGFAEEEVDIVHDSSPAMQKKIAALLVKILEKARVTTKKTNASLPSFSVFSSIISVPQMSQKDLEQAIPWQAKKFIPLPLEEMNLSSSLLDSKVKTLNQKKKHHVDHADKIKDHPQDKKTDSKKPTQKSVETRHALSKTDKKDKKDMKVLIAAAPKKLASRYINVFKSAGLELMNLETENFALVRSLVGAEKVPIMIVDIGSITSDITIVENGVPLLSRSVDTGGNAITQSVMKSMHIDAKRAEQFKRDVGFSAGQGNLPKIIEASLTPIINEIKYCFDLYASQTSQERIEKIVLTGGSAFLPNIVEYLTSLLNIKIFIGDPWARVIYPVELKSVLYELAPRFSVAVGLAMRDIV